MARGSEQSAWIVDIDGTLALMGERGPFDWHRVGEDRPHLPVIIAVQALAAHPGVDAILAVSGRDGSSRGQTVQWLDAQGVPFDELHMREPGDFRPDEVVKEALYRERIEGRFRVLGVLDDRDKVVAMWRSIGLVCFQVAPGDF
ncbi:phosphatase domain-containing protein [Tomitella biformata]|uniref:phosphatase domain-containing protein n=1 Tax=Tomitella biformata TaxID=630403 RepID=UPI000466E1DD|nr:hypothetical protein [Tomitella biformata]